MKLSQQCALVFGSLLCVALAFDAPSAASTAATVTTSGDGIAVEYMGEDGTKMVETIPLHKAGEARYFSAGNGLEERMGEHPSFPLKLIFVAGHKAYLSQVSVTITDAKVAVTLQVPGKQITGLWLFVDLPPGTYTIAASRNGQTQIVDSVALIPGTVKTMYLRWKDASS